MSKDDSLLEWAASHRGSLQAIATKYGVAYSYRYRFNKETYSKYFPAGTPHNFIKARILEIESQMLNDKLGISTELFAQHKTRQPISDLIDWHHEAIISEKLSRLTVVDYDFQLGKFKEWIASQNMNFTDEVTRKHLYLYRRNILDRGCSIWSAEHAISKVKAFFNRAFSQGIIEQYPFAGYKGLQKPETQPRSILSPAEMKIISAMLPENIRPIWDILRFTGMRLADSLRIQIENIDYGKRTIGFIMPKRKHKFVILPFHHKLVDLLYPFCGKRGPIFIFSDTYKDHTIGKLFAQRIIKLKGLEFIRPGSNTPRHSFAAFLRESNVRWEDIQFLLGHKILGVTDRYTHDSILRLRSIIDSLPLDGIEV